MRRFATVDFTQYVKAVGLLIRNPVIVLAPLAAAMCTAALQTIFPSSASDPIAALSVGIWQIIYFLINAFGLGVALIAADAAWRTGKVSFDSALDDAKRKVGDILMAAVGLNFVIAAAALIGGIVAAPLAIGLMIVAAFFFIYTLPAAAIGGVPGGASLSISIDRVKSNYLAAILVFIATIAAFAAVLFALPYLLEHVQNLPSVAGKSITALLLSVASSYVALVLAKTYADVSFTVPRW